MKIWIRFIIFALILSSFLVGCASISYLEKSASGHLELLAARQKVEKLANDPKQPAALRTQMSRAQEIRQFAIDQLALPDNKSYKTYVDLGRDYVTVAVFAAPEFSLFPKLWCFPVFGCVPYRAHFSLDDARAEADALEAEGLDVHLSGVTAYSTLGWTSDPLLNTMFRNGDESHLAGVMFHELAHQEVYINDDSAFNEAFAVAVERTGVIKWFESQGDLDALKQYQNGEARVADFLGLVDDARQELLAIYKSDKIVAQKRREKQAAIERLRSNYAKMRDKKWGGYSGFDGWFNGPINNAKIAATAVYSDLVPAFLKLFEACGENYPRFYKAVESLGKLKREERVDALVQAVCG